MRNSDDTHTLSEDPAGDQERTLYGDELAPGALAGEYVIQGTIATGGCGTVYSAEHRVLGRRAAVKVLHRDLASSAEMVERFVREARAVNLIRHPGIVDIYEFGQLQDQRPYYVMELLEGRSLEALLRTQGRFSPSETLAILEPVCGALHAAHRAGIVHRDLKASNIMIGKKGKDLDVKLLDFGIAKLVEPLGMEAGLTSVGRRLGTPHAMAPEQIRGDRIDARTDIYGLGVLTHQLLTGEFPFRADDPAELERLHLEAQPPRPSQAAPVSPAIDAVVLRCLEKDPARRFESGDAFMEALRQAVGGARRTAAAPVSVSAAAIYVELRVEEAAQETADDALLDDMSLVLDITDRMLCDGGFVVPLQTGSAVLGVIILPEDAEGERGERVRVLELAERINAAVTNRPTPDARLRVNLCVHVDKALIRDKGSRLEVVGGSIVRIGAWAPQLDLAEPCATPAAVAGLGEIESAGQSHIPIRALRRD